MVDGDSYSLLEYSKLASELCDLFIGIDRNQHYVDEYAPVARFKHQTTDEMRNSYLLTGRILRHDGHNETPRFHGMKSSCPNNTALGVTSPLAARMQ